MAESKLADKQYLARILFTREHLDQKVVAERVGVSEKTMSKWVNEGNWKEHRRRLMLTKEEQLLNLYEQLECLNKDIKENSPLKYGNAKQTDIQRKLTASIKELETDLGIAEIVESGIRFIKYVQATGTTEQVIEISDFWNSFIQSSIRK